MSGKDENKFAVLAIQLSNSFVLNYEENFTSSSMLYARFTMPVVLNSIAHCRCWNSQ
jgi:hypothetical protein